MKNIKLIVATLALIFATTFAAQAQAPYKNGFGVSVGNMQAPTFKTFGGNHFAFQLDLGTKIVCTNGRYSKHLSFEGLDIWDLELNPNFMFEGRLGGGLYGFVGLGASIGYSWSGISYNTGWFGIHHSRADLGKCGANGIFGLEYKFKAPVALQFDFRPGYGCLFAKHTDVHYFDWGLNFGVRYTF